MGSDLNQTDSSDRCEQFSASFQDYLDGALPKTQSLELFLHLRECSGCREGLSELQEVIDLLEGLPAAEVPDGFDDPILEAVPYQAYRDMVSWRRDRVPVYLAEDFLPAPLRDVRTRVTGGALAALAAVGLAASWLPDLAFVVVFGGILPEATVRLQQVARKLSLSGQGSESG